MVYATDRVFDYATGTGNPWATLPSYWTRLLETVEAINHAKAAGVPIIVALNKIDLEGANPDRVKQQLAEQDFARQQFLTTIAQGLRGPLSTAAGTVQVVLANPLIVIVIAVLFAVLIA
ncbi:MAG TPA: hypothetical protein PKK84_01275, partial [Armatimonadota bacterium]|nr:hypothetical protein [Armatimonadota bacterium]